MSDSRTFVVSDTGEGIEVFDSVHDIIAEDRADMRNARKKHYPSLDDYDRNGYDLDAAGSW